jgi:hypothetical protein
MLPILKALLLSVGLDLGHRRSRTEGQLALKALMSGASTSVYSMLSSLCIGQSTTRCILYSEKKNLFNKY